MNRRTRAWIIVAALAAPSAAPARAAGPARFQGAIDLYSTGGVDRTFKDEVQNVVNFLNDSGVSSSGEVTTTAGLGFRTGLLSRQENGFELGVTVGFIVGPEVTEKVTNGPFSIGSTPFPSGGETKVTIDTTYLRLLIEAGKKFPLSDRIAFRLGAGAGVAHGNVDQKMITSGSAGALFDGGESKEGWTGVTWEAEPSFVFTAGDRADLELGLRYAQFPRKSASDNIAEIDWKPVSLFAALRFGASDEAK